MMNLLPYDGIVNYYPNFLGNEETLHLYDALYKNISWKHDEVMILGKRIITKRMMAWYATGNIPYKYSQVTRQSNLFTRELQELLFMVEKTSGESYNACLLNLYHNGDEGMGWHSDNEPSIGHQTAIASVSLGENRRFSFRHKISGLKVEMVLESGSLLVMKGRVQSCWQHALPKSKKVRGERINLTFRNMIVTTQ